MRGKARVTSPADAEIRITPAYAGKRRRAKSISIQLQDHPRLCGEKFKIAFVLFALSGSPPPMRGKGLLPDTKPHLPGITPAYAGKSAVKVAVISINRDHPRLCGEKPAKISVDGYVTGSPPPMRGKECGKC